MDTHDAGWAAIGAGLLAALAAAYNKAFGDPEKRMAHEAQLTTQQHQHEETLEKIEAEVETTADSAAIGALERRMDAMERVGREQATKIGLLGSTNTRLVKRVQQLERQAEKDAATIADLRAQLDAAQAEIERWASQCGACPHQVHLEAPAPKAKPASKKRRKQDA